jgi:sterol desaturase/sphingolipid hydroxylase (fatty acid hydroxylase superfamily)
VVARRGTRARLGTADRGVANVGKAIALATPFFFGLIALEYAWGRLRGRDTYRLNDAVNSLSLGVLSQLSNLFTQLLRVGIYAVAYAHLALWQLPVDAWWVWVLGIIFYDFCYYWNHRLGHESAIFWAAHVVHHQSPEFNLSTALRQTSTGALLSWVFYLPMAVVGIPPQVFVVAALIDLLYQYWIHTEHVGRLGWLDRVVATPSNHRVHHAVNDRYLDRNYGGIFILWDRLFGSFVAEEEKCVYGTRAPLDSWDPLWANLEVYADLARKSRVAPRWSDKLRVWFKPPGWRPTGADAASWPSARFAIERLRRYDPPMSPTTRWFATIELTLSILATIPLLWFAGDLPLRVTLSWSFAVAASLWLVGAVMQRRIGIVRALLLQVIAVALAVLAAAA